MKSKSIGRYIDLGGIKRYLRDVREGWAVHGEGYILESIEWFLAALDEFHLPVTRRAAWKLVEFKETVEESPADHTLTREEANQLAEIMDELKNTLMAEAEGNVAFIVTDKRIDVNKLISDIPALMAPGVFDVLPEIAQYDFQEAGKCIAFELPTAAAFHIVRGTEGVLKQFYCSIVKRSRAEFMWGAMVQSLEQRKSKRPPDALLRSLDNIRVSYRNPTQHPEKIYDIQEVQDLFGVCIDVVNRMATSPHWEPPCM